MGRGGGGPVARFGCFDYYTTRAPGAVPLPVWTFGFLAGKGALLHYRRQRYDVIVAYGPFTTALAGFVVRFLTGARLIVEFPGNPMNSFLLNARQPTWLDRLKTLVSKLLSPVVARAADHVRLLYSRQLEGVVKLPERKISAFHYFTPIEGLRPAEKDEPFILCLGGPWYRKGVDLLIAAFHQISHEFGDVSLRVHGYTAEREHYERLAAGHERIHLGKPVPHAEALELIRRCRVYACPSRSEGMPRVIVEAMAAGKPVVASDADGIPSYVEHSVTGLIARTGDVADLAAQLTVALKDRDLARRLGENARAYAMRHLTDQCYADRYREMVEKTLAGSDARQPPA
jgi:glycosyltransferase involved in cell wall biosynthesis